MGKPEDDRPLARGGGPLGLPAGHRDQGDQGEDQDREEPPPAWDP